MPDYVAEIEVDASVERAFAVFVDASRFPQWQAMALHAFEQSGPLTSPGSAVRINHGPRMNRTMTVVDADPPHLLRYRQQGMGVEDTTEVQFAAVGGRTRITMSAELKVAGGPIGRLLERASRGQNRREFQAELERFGAVADRATPSPPPTGAIVTADSGAGFRVLRVLDVDDEVVHLALLPGVASDRPTDPGPFLDEESRLADPLGLRPLSVTLRGLASRIVPGQPVLRLDGGLGVPHVAMSLDAYGDARPEVLGQLQVWPHERAEVTSWRDAAGPVLGRDVDAGITTLVTVRADQGYAAAKVLHVDPTGVHVRLFADRWPIPPDDINPWALRLGTVDDAVFGVGHMPLTRGAFGAMDPSFDRLVLIGPNELDGYRMWLEDGGGYFT